MLPQGKINWKYIIIFLLFAVIITAGILGLIKKEEIFPPELPEKASEETSPEKISSEEESPEIPNGEKPEITCQNECSQIGSKKCLNNGYQTCGNYDEDECLEWSSTTNCPSNTVCQNGSCVQQKCSDGTLYNQCSINKPKYCDNGNLVDNCSICGCIGENICRQSGKCEILPEYSFSNNGCLGITCDGFCYDKAAVECVNGKVVYKFNENDYQMKGEALYKPQVILPSGLDFNLSYPKSVKPSEKFKVEIKISSNDPSTITIDSVEFREWKLSTNDGPFYYPYNGLPFSIIFAYRYKTVGTKEIGLLGNNIPNTIEYELEAPPYPSPYGGRIIISTSFGYLVSNPITIYNPRSYAQCGNKLYDPKVGVCFNDILFPSKYNLGCNNNKDCKEAGNIGMICVYHQCISIPEESSFRANKSYKIPIIPLYLLKNSALDKELQIKEQGYMENIANNLNQWWANEKNKWNPASNFSISYEVVNCNLYYDEYILIAKENSNDPYLTYNKIRERCGIDKAEYEMVVFLHVFDPDNIVYPIYTSINLGDIILGGGFFYFDPSDSRGNYYSRGNSVDTVIHETLHSFGIPDLYDDPSALYHWYDCYINTINHNPNKGLCLMEAVKMGLIK
jgi:hypothetical protein